MRRFVTLSIIALFIGLMACTPESTVAIARDGSGAGRVISDPPGIQCGSLCSASFPGGTTLTLTAEPDAGSALLALGGCTRSGEWSCNLTLGAQGRRHDVSVTFEPRCGAAGWCRQVPAPPPGYAPYWDVWGTSDRDVWAVGGAMVHWDGVSWTLTWERAKSGVRSVWGSGPRDVWAIANNDLLLHWDGVSWTDVGDHPLGGFLALWGSGPNDLWVVGEKGLILHWNGAAWSTQEPRPTDKGLMALWGFGANDVWAVGEGGAAVHWDGASWTLTPTSASSLDTIWGSSPDDIWAAGSSLQGAGAVPVHWDGHVWGPAPGRSSVQANDLWGTGPDDIWAVGLDKIAHWNGAKWTEHTIEQRPHFRIELIAVWASGPGDFWAAGSEIVRRQGP